MAGNTLSLTILSDNNAASGCSAEHGFSLVMETLESTILFDTGRENALLSNAAALGVDLSRTKQLVLSHGHYDHTGCIAELLELELGEVFRSQGEGDLVVNHPVDTGDQRANDGQ